MNIFDIPLDCINVIVTFSTLESRGNLAISNKTFYQKFKNELYKWSLSASGTISFMQKLNPKILRGDEIEQVFKDSYICLLLNQIILI